MVVNVEMLGVCKLYRELPIIIISESMADLCGYVSTFGKITFCGPPEVENKLFIYKGDKPDFISGNHFLSVGGNIRFADSVEILLSLLFFDCNQWGHKALVRIIRCLEPDVDWQTPVMENNLTCVLLEKLETAVALGEDDNSIFDAVDYRFQGL